jgi:hypothetical protein
MNGTWATVAVDSTHIDLVGSAFAAAYVSGGAIGGSLDALTFSLDSISNAATAQLAAVGTTHQLGFFTGPNIEAILETSDGDGQGKTVEINGLRPMTDAPGALVCVGARMSAQSTVVYSPEVVIDDQGFAEAYVETRYARGRMRVPAGTVWNYGQGIQADIGIAGDA